MSFDSGLDIKQRTPMQKLIDKLSKGRDSMRPQSGSLYVLLDGIIKDAESLLPEERQMVIDANINGSNPSTFEQSGEQYFNQKFGSDDKE